MSERENQRSKVLIITFLGKIYNYNLTATGGLSFNSFAHFGESVTKTRTTALNCFDFQTLTPFIVICIY